MYFLWYVSLPLRTAAQISLNSASVKLRPCKQERFKFKRGKISNKIFISLLVNESFRENHMFGLFTRIFTSYLYTPLRPVYTETYHIISAFMTAGLSTL